jgi:hypothetical protein
MMEVAEKRIFETGPSDSLQRQCYGGMDRKGLVNFDWKKFQRIYVRQLQKNNAAKIY